MAIAEHCRRVAPLRTAAAEHCRFGLFVTKVVMRQARNRGAETVFVFVLIKSRRTPRHAGVWLQRRNRGSHAGSF